MSKKEMETLTQKLIKYGKNKERKIAQKFGYCEDCMEKHIRRMWYHRSPFTEDGLFETYALDIFVYSILGSTASYFLFRIVAML